MKHFLLTTFIIGCLCAKAQDSLNMQVLFHWDESTAVPSAAYDNTYNEIWGYAADGREYAIIGTSAGTHFFDITIPSEAVEVDFVQGAAIGPEIVHRDYHNYNNYLYMVCQEGQSSLQIADMSYLPDSVHVVYDSDEYLRGSHNIFIDTVQAKLYAVYVLRPDFQGLIRLQIYDISNPPNPILLEQVTSGPAPHDLYVNDGIALVNIGNGGMVIADYTNFPPEILGSIDQYPGAGYNHSGYPTPDGNIYVMADETHGSPLKMLDISDPTDIEVLSTMSSGVNSLSIAHNQILHDNKVYSAYYYDGVYVWNVENPSSPLLLGYYDTSTRPHAPTYEGAWGVYPFLPSGNILVSDMQTGLWVFSLDETLEIENAPSGEKTLLWPNPCSDVLNVSCSTEDIEAYVISDIRGAQISSGTFTINKKQVDVSHLPVGVYTLNVIGEGNNFTKRFVIAR